jgi:hypothetical protein
LKLRIASLVLLGLAFSVAPSFAQDLYDNGPTAGDTDAWTINSGFAVSDSFILSSNSSVTGLNFESWVFPGDILQTAEVSITSSEFGGTTYFSQTVPFTQSNCGANSYGFDLCTETGTFAPVNLNAGIYWLTLENAVINGNNDPVYWDENSGPSSASENSIGSIPSESFTIIGSASTSSTGSTPEPSTMVLFASGMLWAIGSLRRNIRL